MAKTDDTTCPECGRTFNTTQGRNAHIPRTHGRPKDGTRLDEVMRLLYPNGVPVDQLDDAVAQRKALAKVIRG